MDGYKYSPASETDDERIEFKLGDVDVNISVIDTYQTVAVTYMSYPVNFTL
jgi:hypothetical protein